MKSLSRILFLSLLSVAAFVACGKKSGGGDPAPVPVACTYNQVLQPGQYCNNGSMVQAQPCTVGQIPPQGYACVNNYLIPINATGGTTSLANNLQFANSGFQGFLNVMGTGAVTTGYAQDISSYQGQVAISGIMQVINPNYCFGIPFPASSYQISGTGTMSGGVLGNATLVIQGPVQMQMSVYSAVVAEGRLGIMQAQLLVNGQNCGSITTY